MCVVDINRAILDASILERFSGHDPFDGLNSKVFNFFPSAKKGIIGLAWIQLFKRSPINFRPLLQVPKERNPKGVGLFILGLIEDYQRTQNQYYLNQAIELADWLLTQSCNLGDWQHNCWGYHFDWNARAFFVPKGKPNIITTIYVAQALFSLGELLNEKKYIDPAVDSAHFIINTLYSEIDGRCFFAYIPGETTFVHNASLWGAAWVAKVASVTANSEYEELALKVARQSVSEQKSNGSWSYGALSHHQFVDGFHTGYNLEALDLIRQSLDVVEFDAAISKGLEFYKGHLFEHDGTAKYYDTNKYPLDMHSVSQAVITLLKVNATEEQALFAKKVIDKSIELLYSPQKQHFVYQKSKYHTNRINYMRWTQAWVYYSFAFFNHFTDKHRSAEQQTTGKEVKCPE